MLAWPIPPGEARRGTILRITMRLVAQPVDLVLTTNAPQGGLLATLLRRELDGFAAALQPWGRFSAPVHVHVAADRGDLRLAAQCPTSLSLRAVAGVREIILLDPLLWTPQPSDRDIERTTLHELAHVLLFQRCAVAEAAEVAYIPTWFREGMAAVVALGPPHPGQRRAIAAHPLLAELPDADDAIMAAEPAASYEVAALAFDAWMHRFGAPALTALCRAMRAGHGFASAHQRACAMPATAWIQEWMTAVRREARQE